MPRDAIAAALEHSAHREPRLQLWHLSLSENGLDRHGVLALLMEDPDESSLQRHYLHSVERLDLSSNALLEFSHSADLLALRLPRLLLSIFTRYVNETRPLTTK